MGEDDVIHLVAILNDMNVEFDATGYANPDEAKIYEKLSLYLSGGDEDYDEIIKTLKSKLLTEPDEFIDYIDNISVWEKVEYTFSVKEFCDLVGIK